MEELQLQLTRLIDIMASFPITYAPETGMSTAELGGQLSTELEFAYGQTQTIRSALLFERHAPIMAAHSLQTPSRSMERAQEILLQLMHSSGRQEGMLMQERDRCKRETEILAEDLRRTAVEKEAFQAMTSARMKELQTSNSNLARQLETTMGRAAELAQDVSTMNEQLEHKQDVIKRMEGDLRELRQLSNEDEDRYAELTRGPPPEYHKVLQYRAGLDESFHKGAMTCEFQAFQDCIRVSFNDDIARFDRWFLQSGREKKPHDFLECIFGQLAACCLRMQGYLQHVTAQQIMSPPAKRKRVDPAPPPAYELPYADGPPSRIAKEQAALFYSLFWRVISVADLRLLHDLRDFPAAKATRISCSLVRMDDILLHILETCIQACDPPDPAAEHPSSLPRCADCAICGHPDRVQRLRDIQFHLTTLRALGRAFRGVSPRFAAFFFHKSKTWLQEVLETDRRELANAACAVHHIYTGRFDMFHAP